MSHIYDWEPIIEISVSILTFKTCILNSFSSVSWECIIAVYLLVSLIPTGTKFTFSRDLHNQTVPGPVSSIHGNLLRLSNCPDYESLWIP